MASSNCAMVVQVGTASGRKGGGMPVHSSACLAKMARRDSARLVS